jgi:FixJ family two-component response regulator
MREAIERLLDAAGYECAAYGSAEAMLAAGAGRNAACVVSDLTLPAMSGLELLTALRARGRREPLILITAHDAPGLRENAMKSGAVAYLAKPFRGTALLETIKQVGETAPEV